MPAVTAAKPTPASTVAQPPRMPEASLALVVAMPPAAPMPLAWKSTPEPATARVIAPRLRLRAVAPLRSRVVREPPGRRVRPLKAWVLV